MTNNEYREETKRTLPNLAFREDKRVYEQEVGDKLNLVHMALGLAGEVGELTNCIGTELKIKVDRVNLGEELGDLNWYLSNYCNLRNIPIPEITVSALPNDMCFDLLLKSIGSLVDIVKRYIAYNKEINRAQELQTIYDIYSALHMFEQVYEITGESIRAKNIAKLRVRYPEKFSDTKAVNRDINKENEALR